MLTYKILIEKGSKHYLKIFCCKTQVSEADLLIVGGTSLQVYPASSLVTYFRGKHLVLINKDETPYDYLADIVIHDDLVSVFEKINKSISKYE